MDQAKTQQAGIKETRELLEGVNELALAIIVASKDGVQPMEDFTAIFAKYQADEGFRAKIDAAVKGITTVPTEVADLGAAEIAELVTVQVSYVPKILEAIK